jgi:type I restriction enzyme S subunit
MATEWRTVPIRDLCVDIFDGPHATPKKTSSGPVFLGISSLVDGRLDVDESAHLSEADFTKWTRRVTPRPGDIVFSYETRLGEAAMIPEGLRCCLGRRMALMRPEPAEVDARFLLYAYLGPAFQATIRERTVHGSTVERILLTAFPEFPIAVPDLDTQRSIADLLGALDDKIELNRRMNHTLESIARAVFESWFVDFDPVRKQMEGGEVGLPPALAALFPNRLADSRIGPIPAGWEVGAIGDVVRVVGGSTPSTKEPSYWGGAIAFATPRDMARLAAPVLRSTERRVTAEGAATISSGVLEPGAVLLSSRAPIGYLAISEIPVCVNQGFIVMLCDADLPNHYVLNWARRNMDAIVASANGTTFLEVSKRSFRPLPIMVPPKAVLAAFVALASPLNRRVVAALVENEALAEARNRLLPELFVGRLRDVGVAHSAN